MPGKNGGEKLKVSEDLVYPYCNGCGHIYYHMPKVSRDKASSALCHYCVAEQSGGEVDYPNYPITRSPGNF